MAVLPMKRLSLFAMKKDRKAILELLQRKGVVEISCNDPEDDVFKKTDLTEQCQEFQKNMETAASALEILEKYASQKGSALDGLKGLTELSVSQYEDAVKRTGSSLETAERIVRLRSDIAELTAEIPKLETQITILKPWQSLDLPLNYPGTKTTSFLAGSFPEAVSKEKMLTVLGTFEPELDEFTSEIVSTSPEMTCVYFTVLKSQEGMLEDGLRVLNFAKAPLSEKIPLQEMRDLAQKIAEDKTRIGRIEEEIRSQLDTVPDLKFLQDYYRMRIDRYEVVSSLSQSKRTFELHGWLAAEDTIELESALSGFDLVLEFTDPGPEDDVPVKLKNNGYVSPVEAVVESYSMPARGELDPSPVMATFYYICFGLMLSDAAYGLIMVIVTAILLKKYPKMADGTRRFLKMFFYCGISTTFWGFLFGSFFGDAVNVIATTYFNRPDIALNPIWFAPVDKPMKMLVFSFLVGIIHLFTGLGVKFYSEWKDGDRLGAIYDAGFWYMFVGGGIIYLLTMKMVTDMMGLGFTLSPAAATISGWITILGMIGVVLTGGRSSRNWFKRILKGLYSAYGITSWLSDILSYSRLLALGLATSVISTVFNKMGSMFGRSPIGVVLFILVFVIGHTMNIAINALGAYVHTNRLQYVEFFGKFYEGGGRKIEPFGEKTKYYKVMEAK